MAEDRYARAESEKAAVSDEAVTLMPERDAESEKAGESERVAEDRYARAESEKAAVSADRLTTMLAPEAESEKAAVSAGMWPDL